METKRYDFFKNDIVVYEYLDDKDEVKKLKDRAEISLELFDNIHRIRMNFELNKIEFHENMENSLTTDHLIKLYDNSNDKTILSLNNQRIITLNNLIYQTSNKFQYENLISIDLSFNFIKNLNVKSCTKNDLPIVNKNLNKECLEKYYNRLFNTSIYKYLESIDLNKITLIVLDKNEIENIQNNIFNGLNNVTLIDFQYNK